MAPKDYTKYRFCLIWLHSGCSPSHLPKSWFILTCTSWMSDNESTEDKDKKGWLSRIRVNSLLFGRSFLMFPIRCRIIVLWVYINSHVGYPKENIVKIQKLISLFLTWDHFHEFLLGFNEKTTHVCWNKILSQLLTLIRILEWKMV